MEPQMQHQELQKCRTEHHTAGDRERMSKLQRAAPRTGRDEGHEQTTVTVWIGFFVLRWRAVEDRARLSGVASGAGGGFLLRWGH